ncbi:MAG: DUF86 domain-containing protein [Tannerella sp.]|jgi:uncharacterized protein with HEPN domain|nr:DUF86 domain-containing protein [Tannerella sp.]
MRETVRDKNRLEHILDAINKAIEFIKNDDFEEFKRSALLRFAVVKATEIIGEASYSLTNEFRDNHPEIEWRKIINMRHILVHGYYKIDDKIVWDTVKLIFPELRTQIQSLLDSIKDE